MLVAAVGARDAGRQPLAGDLGDGAGGEVEDDGVGGRQLVQRAHRPAGLDPAAVLAHDRGERVGDRLRAAAGDRPAVAVAGAGQRHAGGRAERPREGAEGVGGGAAEQRPRLRRSAGRARAA